MAVLVHYAAFLCVFTLPFVKPQLTSSVDVQRGNDATLACVLSDTSFTLPEWRTPSGTIIFNQDSPTKNPSLVPAGYASRLSLDSSNNRDLLIATTEDSDAGDYQCSYTSKGDNTITLTVTSPTTSTKTTPTTPSSSFTSTTSISTSTTTVSTSTTSVYESTTHTSATASTTTISTTSATSSITKGKSETTTALPDSSSSETVVIIVVSVVGGLFAVGIVITIILMLLKRKKPISKEIHKYKEDRNDPQFQRPKSLSLVGQSKHDDIFRGKPSGSHFKQNTSFVRHSNRPVAYQYQPWNGRHNSYSLRNIYPGLVSGEQYSGRHVGRDRRVNEAPNYYNPGNLRRQQYYIHPSDPHRSNSRTPTRETLHIDDQNYVAANYSMYW